MTSFVTMGRIRRYLLLFLLLDYLAVASAGGSVSGAIAFNSDLFRKVGTYSNVNYYYSGTANRFKFCEVVPYKITNSNNVQIADKTTLSGNSSWTTYINLFDSSNLGKNANGVIQNDLAKSDFSATDSTNLYTTKFTKINNIPVVRLPRGFTLTLQWSVDTENNSGSVDDITGGTADGTDAGADWNRIDWKSFSLSAYTSSTTADSANKNTTNANATPNNTTTVSRATPMGKYIYANKTIDKIQTKGKGAAGLATVTMFLGLWPGRNLNIKQQRTVEVKPEIDTVYRIIAESEQTDTARTDIDQAYNNYVCSIKVEITDPAPSCSLVASTTSYAPLNDTNQATGVTLTYNAYSAISGIIYPDWGELSKDQLSIKDGTVKIFPVYSGAYTMTVEGGALPTKKVCLTGQSSSSGSGTVTDLNAGGSDLSSTTVCNGEVIDQAYNAYCKIGYAIYPQYANATSCTAAGGTYVTDQTGVCYDATTNAIMSNYTSQSTCEAASGKWSVGSLNAQGTCSTDKITVTYPQRFCEINVSPSKVVTAGQEYTVSWNTNSFYSMSISNLNVNSSEYTTGSRSLTASTTVGTVVNYVLSGVGYYDLYTSSSGGVVGASSSGVSASECTRASVIVGLDTLGCVISITDADGNDASSISICKTLTCGTSANATSSSSGSSSSSSSSGSSTYVVNGTQIAKNAKILYITAAPFKATGASFYPVGDSYATTGASMANTYVLGATEVSNHFMTQNSGYGTLTAEQVYTATSSSGATKLYNGSIVFSMSVEDTLSGNKASCTKSVTFNRDESPATAPGSTE